MEGLDITTITIGLCALLMIGIGISNIISKKSVGFYSGERGPVFKNAEDMKNWNIRHGLLWISYGVIMIIAVAVGKNMENWILMTVVILAGLLLPIPLMIFIHHMLLKNSKDKIN